MKRSVIASAIVASAIGANGQNATSSPLTVTEYYSSCPPSGVPSATVAPGPSPVLPPGVSITIFNYIGQEECGCKDIYTDKTYTVTETCPSEQLGQPKPTDYVPQGFAVTTSVCTVCAETPVTKTATCPNAAASPAAAPAGAPAAAPAAPSAPAAPAAKAAPAAAPAGAAPAAPAAPAAAPAGGAPAAAAPAAPGAPAAAPAAAAGAPAAPAAPASPPYPAAGSPGAGAAAPSSSAGTNAKVAPFTGGASTLLTNAFSNICAVIGMALLAL